MSALAWAVVACWAFLLLPGSSLKRKIDLRRDVDWRTPHVYVTTARNVLGLALAIWVIA